MAGIRATRGLSAVLAAVTFALCVSVGLGDGATVARGPEAFPQQLSRIVSARVHHTRIPTVRNSNSLRSGARWPASTRPGSRA